MPERTRHFPPPWTVEETAPSFIVRDHNVQALAFVYCEDEPRRAAAICSPATRLGGSPPIGPQARVQIWPRLGFPKYSEFQEIV